MNPILFFLREYWLEIVLVLGVAGAVYFVYRNRHNLLKKPN
jgi:hypothetical protein